MKPDRLMKKAIRHAAGVACISSFCAGQPEIRSMKGLLKRGGGSLLGRRTPAAQKEDYATVLDTVRWQESQ